MSVLAQKRISNKQFGDFFLRVPSMEVDPEDSTKIVVAISFTREGQKYEMNFSLPLTQEVCRRNRVFICQNVVYGKVKLANIILGFIYTEPWSSRDGIGIVFKLPVERFGVETIAKWTRATNAFRH